MKRLLSVVLLLWPAAVLAADPGAVSSADRARHVLDRLGYGPRPGDVARVEHMGIERYISQQLHPESIDDSDVERKLRAFETLRMDSPELMRDFYAEIRRFVANQERAGPPPSMAERLRSLPSRISLRAVGELQTAKILRAAESERQLYEVLVDFWSNHFNVDVKKGPVRVLKVVDEREVIRPHVLGRFRDLLGASARSPAMLHYLDNTQSSKAYRVSEAEREIRDRVYGGLTGLKQGLPGPRPDGMEGGLNENYARELLELHTLGVDGGYSQRDVVEVARCFTGWAHRPLTGEFVFMSARHDDGEKTVLGHVVPAGGGRGDGERVLDIVARHPSTARFIAAKLCRRFVSDDPPEALVERAAGVFRKTDGDLRAVVETIVTSREMQSAAAYRAKVKPPFDLAVSALRALGGTLVPDADGTEAMKIRHALEGAATLGYAREALAQARRQSLNWHIAEMAQPLYAFEAPTGYPEDSRRWISASALLARMNFALSLTAGTVSDVRLPPPALPGNVDLDDPEAVVRHLVRTLLPGEPAATRETLLREARREEGATANLAQLTALVLGSPEFQRR